LQEGSEYVGKQANLKVLKVSWRPQPNLQGLLAIKDTQFKGTRLLTDY